MIAIEACGRNLKVEDGMLGWVWCDSLRGFAVAVGLEPSYDRPLRAARDVNHFEESEDRFGSAEELLGDQGPTTGGRARRTSGTGHERSLAPAKPAWVLQAQRTCGRGIAHDKSVGPRASVGAASSSGSIRAMPAEKLASIRRTVRRTDSDAFGSTSCSHVLATRSKPNVSTASANITTFGRSSTARKTTIESASEVTTRDNGIGREK